MDRWILFQNLACAACSLAIENEIEMDDDDDDIQDTHRQAMYGRCCEMNATHDGMIDGWMDGTRMRCY